MNEEASRRRNIILFGSVMLLGFLLPVTVPVVAGREMGWRISFVNFEALGGSLPGAVVLLLLYPGIAGVGVFLLSLFAVDRVRSVGLIILGLFPLLVVALSSSLHEGAGLFWSEMTRAEGSVPPWLLLFAGIVAWTGIFIGSRTRWYRPDGAVPYYAGLSGAVLFVISLLIPADLSTTSSMPLIAPFVMIAGQTPLATQVPGLHTIMVLSGLLWLCQMTCFGIAAWLCASNRLGDPVASKLRARIAFRWFVGSHIVVAVWLLTALSFLPSDRNDVFGGFILMMMIKGALFVGLVLLLVPVGLSDLIVSRTVPCGIPLPSVPRRVGPGSGSYAPDDDALFARRGESATVAPAAPVEPEFTAAPEPPPQAPPAQTTEMEEWNAEVHPTRLGASAHAGTPPASFFRRMPRWMMVSSGVAVLGLIPLVVWVLLPGDDGLKPAIESNARLFVQELKYRNFGSVVDRTWPSTVGGRGGRAGLKRTLESNVTALRERGVTLSSVEVGDAGKVRRKNGILYSLVPKIAVYKTPQGTLTKETTLLVLSTDKEHWYVVDSEGMTDKDLADAVPELAGAFALPPGKESLSAPTP